MSQTTKTGRLRPVAKSLLDALRQFLTPAVYKKAHQARAASRQPARWDTQSLLLTLLVLTWCTGDSIPERFETARAFTVVCRPKRRRPGDAVGGFQKALAKVPLVALRTVAAAVRCSLAGWFTLVGSDGFAVFGCDGSRLECPRSAELESRLGQSSNEAAAPNIWVTALVHLRTGLLWSWRLGKGDAAERKHLQHLLPTLPKHTLLVADAGFNGYDLARAIVTAGASFLIRMSAKVTLYLDGPLPDKDFSEGEVLCWPRAAKEKGLPPVRCRLIRLRGRKKKLDVWLLTDVLESKRLPRDTAARYYRWRWENEGLFRTYKRTLGKVKLLSRTVRLVHREAEGSLLATMLLLAWGAQAVAGRGQGRPARCSPRKVLLEIRQELASRKTRQQGFGNRLKAAQRERRPNRRSQKEKREWPRRQKHKPPKPPKFLKLSEEDKSLLAKLESDGS